MQTFKDIVLFFQNELISIYPTNEIESITRLILEDILNISYAEIVLMHDVTINDTQKQRLIDIAEQLKQHKPIQYILGKAYFYDLKLKVTPDVLIPRSETEELVDLIIKEAVKYNNPNLSILDIGTGSGCIAIALKKNLPLSNISAIDISEKALEIAKQNAKQNLTNITFLNKDITNYESVEELSCFDIIVSNPPYVREKEKSLMQKNVLNYEPALALFVKDENPLIFYKSIFEFASNHLSSEGKIYLEINESLGKEMERLSKDFGYNNVQLIKDLNGKDRILKCTK